MPLVDLLAIPQNEIDIDALRNRFTELAIYSVSIEKQNSTIPDLKSKADQLPKLEKDYRHAIDDLRTARKEHNHSEAGAAAKIAQLETDNAAKTAENNSFKAAIELYKKKMTEATDAKDKITKLWLVANDMLTEAVTKQEDAEKKLARITNNTPPSEFAIKLVEVKKPAPLSININSSNVSTSNITAKTIVHVVYLYKASSQSYSILHTMTMQYDELPVFDKLSSSTLELADSKKPHLWNCIFAFNSVWAGRKKAAAYNKWLEGLKSSSATSGTIHSFLFKPHLRDAAMNEAKKEIGRNE